MVENMQLGGENKQNITAWEFIPGTLEPHNDDFQYEHISK